MKKLTLTFGVLCLAAVSFTSCKECKTCQVTTITTTPTMTGQMTDTTIVAEEFCGILLENVEGTPATGKEDVAADGTITRRTWTECK